jgi:hypothetical protein
MTSMKSFNISRITKTKNDLKLKYDVSEFMKLKIILEMFYVKFVRNRSYDECVLMKEKQRSLSSNYVKVYEVE